VRGEEVASAKLTADDVRAIRRDERTRAEIAAQYGISKATVSSIWARRTWKHVED
jgi:DNA invertase Pin-like site-specific DNA recombinase